MFRVLVVGGIALVGGNACGGSGSVSADAGAHDGVFPSELPVQSDASSRADSEVDTGFPSETNAGSSSDAASEGGLDAGVVNDAAPETGRDAADSAACPPSEEKIGDSGCFPIETM
jgi:hypothetical protein